jgi:Rft protein
LCRRILPDLKAINAFSGVYDVVGNLGSLAARLVFSKIEESAYFYFTQTVSREKNDKNKVGVIICT